MLMADQGKNPTQNFPELLLAPDLQEAKDGSILAESKCCIQAAFGVKGHLFCKEKELTKEEPSFLQLEN